MKTQYILHALVLSVLAATLAFFILSFDKKPTTTYKVSGDGSASQQVPAVPSIGSATLNGTYDSDNNTLIYTINWTGLTNAVTAAHLHGPAIAGINADPLYDLAITTNGTAGVASGTLIISDSIELHLLAGKVYYNLHTIMYSNGEVRGQAALEK